MEGPQLERRRRRSSDTRTALGLQLDAVREAGALGALVLADEVGLVVAAAGDPELCQELAALAPILWRYDFLPPSAPLDGKWVHCREVSHEGNTLFVASCSDSVTDVWSAQLQAWLACTTAGVERILAA